MAAFPISVAELLVFILFLTVFLYKNNKIEVVPSCFSANTKTFWGESYGIAATDEHRRAFGPFLFHL
jgi:hypothetical protein